jgi:hypothetical protein
MAAGYRAGQTTTELARIFGTDSGTISYRLRRAGVVMRTNAQAKRRYTLREDAFVQVGDEATAYWFGFLCADGCISQRRGSGAVHLVLARRDLSHLERFAAFMATDKPLRKTRRYNTYELVLYSRPLSDDLIWLGCTVRKSLTLTWPVLSLGLETHFVRGYFDGDGSAHAGGRYKGGVLAFVGTAPFLSRVQETIRLATGAQGGITPHSRSAAMYLRYSGQFQTWAVADWLYQGATVYLERKHAAVALFPRGKRKGYPTAGRYIGTAGSVSSETIRKYIEAQQGV